MAILGLLKIRVLTGIDLIVQDVLTSDPYVIITMGNQQVKTDFVSNSCNPQWNQELTLLIKDSNPLSILLEVWDKDTLTTDDRMGDAEIDIKPYIKMMMELLEDGKVVGEEGKVVKKVEANSKMNCLVEESWIYWKKGRLIQDMNLKLRNVQSGQVQIQIECIHQQF